jgi:hypothetical protein
MQILQPSTLSAWCSRIGIPQEGCAALQSTALAITKNPELHKVFAEFYTHTTVNGGWLREWASLPVDPAVQQSLGDDASRFYLLGYMAALPAAEQEYHRRGISIDVFDATMHDITFYFLEDSDIAGRWCFNHFPWIWRHLTCELFRLGRLQFMLLPFPFGVTAFRSKTGGGFLLLADPGQTLRADGSAEGAGGKPSQQPVWTPAFSAASGGWRGFPISPYGDAQQREVFLPADEWQVVLQKGDTVLDIHIPRGQSLQADEVRDSLSQAFAFFAAQRPDNPIRASYCHTWFFTPQLQTILAPSSSIVRFQREFYLFPFAGGPAFLWTFVFGEKYRDAAAAPRDTSLRRAVLDWSASGNELYDLPGLRFHPPGDWGSQPYMRAWDDASEVFLRGGAPSPIRDSGRETPQEK